MGKVRACLEHADWTGGVWAGSALISGVLIGQVCVGKVRACLERADWTGRVRTHL